MKNNVSKNQLRKEVVWNNANSPSLPYEQLTRSLFYKGHHKSGLVLDLKYSLH